MKGVFALFPERKSAEIGSYSGSELLPESSPSTPAAHVDALSGVELLAKFQQLSDHVGDLERTYSYNAQGSRRISTGFAASSPRRGIVFNYLRLGLKRVRETMMVWGDGTGYSGWPRHCDHAAAVPAVRRVVGAFGSVP